MPIRLTTQKNYDPATIARLDAIHIDFNGAHVNIFVTLCTESGEVREQVVLSSEDQPTMIAALNNGPGGADVARQLRRNVIAFLTANAADLAGTEEGE